MRDVVTAAADNREDADRYKALADHNLQEYRKVRDAAHDLVCAVEAYWPNSQPPRSIQTAIRKLRGESS